MTHYLLSIHGSDCHSHKPMSPEEMQRAMEPILALEEELKSAGVWVFGGGLHEVSTASVVRVTDGSVLTTDGPFIESKEHLGGFYIIDAEDLDAALAWAAKVTGTIGAPIEVRPFMARPGD